MKSKRYSAYKQGLSSNISSLPEHWSELPLKRVFKIEKRDPKDGDEIITAFRDGKVTLRKNRREDGFTNALKEIGYQRIHRNDLVIHAMDAFAGAIGVSDADGKSSPVYSACTAIKDAVPHFYAYYLRDLAVRGFIESLAKGIRERSTDFRWSDASMVAVPVPPRSEQQAITNFLDNETSKIDSLIAEQRRLIELLKEKRQAVVSQVVTKGLKANVTMKDTGVEWLGEVPKHWEIKAIKHLVSTPVTDGPHETPELVDEGVPFLSAEAVSSGKLDFDKKRGCIRREDHEKYSAKYIPAKHDIFMIKSGATTGITAIVETEEEFNIWSPLAAIRCNKLIDPFYLLAFMRSFNFQSAVALGWNFGTQQNIGMKVIENLFVAVPPQDEQRAATKYLESILNPIDKQLDLAESSIALLQERRSALISATVTGQIDVRSLGSQQEVTP